jgi:hypothetical protein
MVEAIDRVERRKLISQAAKRLRRRRAAKPGAGAAPAEGATRAGGPGSRAVGSRLLRKHPATTGPWPRAAEAKAAERDLG